MKKIHIFILTLVAIVALVVVLIVLNNKEIAKSQNPTRLAGVEKVAQCLTQKNAKFYGASWCSHCARQKSLFLKSIKSLPYTECSTGGPGSPQTQVCIDSKVESYPTWVFENGERINGTVSPLELAEKVGCELTAEETAELSIQREEFNKELGN